jgi:hypothetical protein
LHVAEAAGHSGDLEGRWPVRVVAGVHRGEEVSAVIRG